jgi:hypothetical protein
MKKFCLLLIVFGLAFVACERHPASQVQENSKEEPGKSQVVGKSSINPEWVTGIATVACAVIALVTSSVSILVAVRALFDQRRHNLSSVKPFPNIALKQYRNLVGISIVNHGVGPLIINKFLVWKGAEKEKTKNDVISWAREDPSLVDVVWNDYRSNIGNGVCIRPSEEFPVILLKGKSDDKEFCNKRDAFRTLLSQLSMILEYTDVHGEPVATLTQDWKWFAPNQEPPEQDPKPQPQS